MSDPFWLEKPSILVEPDLMKNLWPKESMTTNEKLNAITRLVILLTLLGFIMTKTLRIVITGIVTIIAIVILRKVAIAKKTDLEKKSSTVEAFRSDKIYEENPEKFAEITSKNPLSNNLIGDNLKTKKPAPPSSNESVEKNINTKTATFIQSSLKDKKLKDKLFCDLGDNFTFNQSMRTWYSIPNDQDEFAKFCYGNMLSCKDTVLPKDMCG